MSSSHTTTATTVKAHLELLEQEFALAALEGLDHDGAYMADLREERSAVRSHYVGRAVTEIACLRALLDGPLQG